MIGLFNRDVRELLSTYYQFDAPFVADHSAFTTAFGGHVTDWDEIIHTTIASYRQHRTDAIRRRRAECAEPGVWPPTTQRSFTEELS